jgi:hypothetical protein
MSEHTDLMRRCEKQLDTVGVNQRGGKKYMMVRDRIVLFRETYGLDYGVTTTLLHACDERVCVQAQVTDGQGRVIGSGLAEEQRGGTGVNKASALENCESSAIGRALASLGLHGGEYPTLDEIASDERSRAALDEREPPAEVAGPAEIYDDIPFNVSLEDSHTDWAGWVDDQVQGFEKHKNMAEHRLWSSTVKADRERLEKEEPDEHARLLSHYTMTKSKLEKGITT